MKSSSTDLVEVFSNPTADKINKYEDILEQMPQVVLNTTHCVSGEVYARTILIPAGVSLVGAVHNKDHINIMCGDITVTTDDGMKRLTGFHVFATKAGMKRVGYAHADTTWSSIMHTKETEIDKIEEDITPDSHKLQTRRLGITSKTIGLLEGE